MISQTTKDRRRLFLVSQRPHCHWLVCVWDPSADPSHWSSYSIKPLPGVFSGNGSDSEDTTVVLEDCSLCVTLGWMTRSCQIQKEHFCCALIKSALCLENSMDEGTWGGTVHGVAKSWTWLNDKHFLAFAQSCISAEFRVTSLGAFNKIFFFFKNLFF